MNRFPGGLTYHRVSGGGNDFILSNGAGDFVIAGAANDVIGGGGDNADDVVLGDHGQLNFDANGLLTRAFTSDPNDGGNDEVYSAEGRDVVWSHPAFAAQCIFARNDRELVCYKLAKE